MLLISGILINMEMKVYNIIFHDATIDRHDREPLNGMGALWPSVGGVI